MTATLHTTLVHQGNTYRAELATINKTTLGREDHGWFQAVLDVDLASGGSTGIGGHSLDTNPEKSGSPRRPTAYGLGTITEMIRVVVGHYGSWEAMSGKRFFALYDADNRSNAGEDCLGMSDLEGKRVLIFNDLFENTQPL